MSYVSIHSAARSRLLGACAVFAALIATLCVSATCLAASVSKLPPVRHVFIIMLENESYQVTFNPQSPAPYLANELPQQGALLSKYYGIGHYSLDNYIAMISGQAPNPDTQADCSTYSQFVPTGKADANGQLPGAGCVYPKSVRTLANQLTDAGLTWKAYMEDMGLDPAREAATCAHPAIGAADGTEHAAPNDQYATKHNPFMYFHAIIDDKKYCDQRVVNLDHLANDLAHLDSTPNLVYITPNLCHDGHDAPCKDGKQPGGLISANAFLKTWVPRITQSPAFKKDGLLIITFDEGNDGTVCCHEKPLPGGPQPGGKMGPGGGRIGAVLLSPFIAPGTKSDVEYNHYSLLRTLENIYGFKHLGYAKDDQLNTFGADVFTAHPSKSK
ncbi:MAG TPA: alkaline phosphatase family protein [Dyella sp.]|uniref:alkaline phosphatase family protein n=1 Tax=Dyella sp. TaxID=1869338 RepID=UPI002CC3B27F|nr:alkaline phosphatase family protein [Dyella sp.]HTV84692.1 alkaline phosphatase family protein [Dyella sp.]